MGQMASDLQARTMIGGSTLPQAGTELDNLCINTIRTLAIDGVEKAKSGHPGLPMGFAPAAYVLWTRFLRHDPNDPKWPDRDRFVLSAGHGSMMLYALLHLTGYDLPLEQLQQFRQWGSRTPGHPELGLTPGWRSPPVRSARDLETGLAWRWRSATWQIATTNQSIRLSTTVPSWSAAMAISWRGSVPRRPR